MNSSNNPVRKTPRAQWHNYNGADYFVTICTKNHVHYFGEVVEGEMQLTEVVKHVQECIIKMGEIHSDIEIPLFVVMPNHIHIIIKLEDVAGLSYHGSRDEPALRLPQCDSPTDI